MSSTSQPAAEPRALTQRQALHPLLALQAGLLLVCGGLLAAILLRHGGSFAYTLDAPYTQLALAEQILGGTYGLNPGEPASPSSSILYPFLLAALAVLPLGQWPPLLVNLAAAMASMALLYALAREAGIRLDRVAPWMLVLFAATASLALNLAGLAFAGLEHSLHVSLTLASLLGLLRFLRRGQAEWWWLASMVLLPLLRFEATAALAADVLVLALYGRWRHALAVLLAGGLPVLAFCWFLHSQGLPWLPLSVLDRSRVAVTGLEVGASGPLALVQAIYAACRTNLMAYGGAHIAALLVALAAAFRWEARRAVVVGFCGLICVAQLAGGSLNSFSRYEIYVLVLGLAGLMVLHAPAVEGWLARLRPAGAVLGCAAVLLLGAGYVIRTADAVPAAGNVLDQQRTMRLFVLREWRQPFATNHPGLVNWRNPYPMLELSGLGSYAARLGAQGGDPDWADKLARRQGVALAMLYDNAIPLAPPAAWQPVARLVLRGRVVTAVGPSITFYATRPEAVEELRAALARFAPEVPAGARLELAPWGATLSPPLSAVPLSAAPLSAVPLSAVTE